ncbi:MAG TPA: TIM-barrel domain-containing protein [Thermoleophilaceae bacterium]
MRRALLVALAAALWAAPAAAATPVRDGGARFEVISPTLIRLEYASDGRFENRPSMTAVGSRSRRVRLRVRRRAGILSIRTSRLSLRYRRGSGPFTPTNVTVSLRLGKRTVSVHPSFPGAPGPTAGPPSLEVSPYTVAQDPGYQAPSTGNLGGWYRALDLSAGPVHLHDGLLSRDGWYLLDDTHTALLQSAAPGYASRPAHAGAYQDGYFFGYGRSYLTGLADLRRLTGPAPLLPRQAFGVWFSRYNAYKQSDYPGLLARFRAERVPLDVLMVDTDFKAPHRWNGWEWYRKLFPDPRGFLRWAHAQGLAVGLNTHPSITSDDPRLPEAQRRAGHALPNDPTGARCKAFVGIGDVYAGGLPGVAPGCKVFDWSRAGDQAAYAWLHEPFERDGVDFWWLDYCCDESYALAPGLTQDTWINRLYAQRSAARGSRWPVLSRVGASVFDPDSADAGIWAEHRSAIHFTGDARPKWEMLNFQTVFSPAEGSVGLPYVSHDIGGFGSVTSDGTAGRHLADDLYVRWVQSGTFQPILRLHSDHGDRLPWDYTGKARRVAATFLRLRGALVPYLYTLARRAYDSGAPLLRPMYLGWPAAGDAYTHSHQYMLGPHLLVAPVGTPGDPAQKEVWFPPGTWTDIFTRQRYRGPALRTLSVPLERMPVFARAGAIVPRQDYRPGDDRRPPATLIVDAYPGRRGAFTLYEDAGDGLTYKHRRFARTRISQRRRGRRIVITIGRARGSFSGKPRRRSYVLRVLGARSPRSVRIRRGRLRWRFDHSTRTLVIRTGRLRTARSARIVVR